uniref:Uncharacterized protein n=1 Tax=Plectus sambesii TaxID=2011161 RepID=A0A914UR72_9BILA
MELGHRRPSGGEDGDAGNWSRTVRGGDPAATLANGSEIAARRSMALPDSADDGRAISGWRAGAGESETADFRFLLRPQWTRDDCSTARRQCRFSSLEGAFMPPFISTIQPLYSAHTVVRPSRAAPSANDASMSSRCALSSSEPRWSAAFTHTASLGDDYARHAAVDDYPTGDNTVALLGSRRRAYAARAPVN